VRCFLRSSPFVARIACPTFAVCLKLVFVDAALRCPSQSSPIITYQRPTTGRQARPRASAQLFIYTFPTSDGSGDGFDGRLDRTRRVSNDGRHADSRRRGSRPPHGRAAPPVGRRPETAGLHPVVDDDGMQARWRQSWQNEMDMEAKQIDCRSAQGPSWRCPSRLTNLYVKSSFCPAAGGRRGSETGWRRWYIGREQGGR